MTDKAIGLLIEAHDQARSLGFLTGTTNWAGVLAKAVAEQPDCRTCIHIAVRKDNCFQGCTNGDKYQPAPKLVLWKT